MTRVVPSLFGKHNPIDWWLLDRIEWVGILYIRERDDVGKACLFFNPWAAITIENC
jgi:hypothetical protein